MTVILTGSDLTLDEVVRVARERERVELHADAAERMMAARTVVEAHLEAGTPVYGMTTGVAARKRHQVPLEKQDEHNRLLVQDLLVGQGAEAPEEVVRATILRLVNGFARGTSGMRPLIADRLVEALNNGAHPPVAMLGSVGMADLARWRSWRMASSAISRWLRRSAISLVDNDAFSTALAALAIHDYGRLLDAFDTAGALDLEAFGANLTILHAAVGREHPYVGLQTTIERLRAPPRGQPLWDDGAARNLQDPLSYRCLPQVHGAAREALAYAERQLAIELNGSQENPLIVLEESRIMSVGNFDPLVLATALDFLRIALAPVVTAGCERMIKLMQTPFSGLPEGLARAPDSAPTPFPQLSYIAAALTGEARLLAQPVSFELPTTTIAEGIEDRMTFAPLAARRLAEMISLARARGRARADRRGASDRAPRPGAPRRRHRSVVEKVRERLGAHGTAAGRIDVEPVVELVRSGELSPEAICS